MQMVLGIFNKRGDADDAISQLENHGFNPKDLSVVMKDTEDAKAMASETGVNTSAHVAGGVITGGVLGGIAGLLIGIGAIAIPGVGAVLIGGPLAAALGMTGVAATTASGAVTGALAGGLIGALTSLGVSEDDAEAYEKSIQSGGILLIVPVSAGEVAEVSDIMRYNNAEQIRTVTESARSTRRLREDRNYSPAYFSEVSRDDEADENELLEEEPAPRRVKRRI